MISTKLKRRVEVLSPHGGKKVPGSNPSWTEVLFLWVLHVVPVDFLFPVPIHPNTCMFRWMSEQPGQDRSTSLSVAYVQWHVGHDTIRHKAVRMTNGCYDCIDLNPPDLRQVA